MGTDSGTWPLIAIHPGRLARRLTRLGPNYANDMATYFGDGLGGGVNPLDKSFVRKGKRRAILEMNFNFASGRFERFGVFRIDTLHNAA